jgi:predicted nucleic acid-binding protein
MNPVLFDTSVYISSLRRGDDVILQTRNVLPGSPLWLSAVVLEELYASIGEKYGYELIGRARLTNDTLIGASAARQGIALLTINERDFAKIAEFCPLKWGLW